MALYRKLPVEVEAIQFTRRNIDEVMKLTKNKIEITTEKRINGIMTGKIETLEGIMTVNENDYIIKGVNGEIYPCKIEIFEKTYERIDQEVEVHTKPLEAELPEVRKRIGPTIIDKIITNA